MPANSTPAARPSASPPGERYELYRVLGDPARLRVLALCAAAELSSGELAELLRESQPNVSRYLSTLRQAGLVLDRREGTRVFARAEPATLSDPVVADAVAAGRALCRQEGLLLRLRDVMRAREAQSRAYFAKKRTVDPELSGWPRELSAYLSILAPLLPHRAVAVDAGTGDGALIDVLAPVFDHVFAFDREQAQLAAAQRRIAARSYANVTLLQGEPDGADVMRSIADADFADVVFAARLLHHAPRPQLVLAQLAELTKPGGHLVLLDYFRHDDDSMRDQGDIWLGFDLDEAERLAREAGLVDISVNMLALPPRAPEASGEALLDWIVLSARRRGAPDDRPLFSALE